MILVDGEMIEIFFVQDLDDFVVDVEFWLVMVGGSVNLVGYDEVVEYFVDYFESEYGILFINVINVELIIGILYNIFICGSSVVKNSINFLFDDVIGMIGMFIMVEGELIVIGIYGYVFGCCVLVLIIEISIYYLVFCLFNIVNQVYSFCWFDNFM